VKHPPQEPDLVPGPAIAGIGAGVVMAVIAGVLVAHFLGSCRARQLGTAWLPPAQLPELPSDVNAMETRPFTVEAQGLGDHARDEAWLRSYGWVDRAAGIAHLPIDTAAGLYLERRAQRGRP
jgi:hypothetical protein